MGETDSQNIPQSGMPQGVPTKAVPSATVTLNPSNMPAPMAGAPMGRPVPAPQMMGPHPMPNPAQSGSMPAVAATAPAPAPAPAPMPAQPTAQLPVAVPGPDYQPPIAGGVNPATPGGNKPKKRNGLLIFGIIVALLAAAVLVIALIYVTMREQNEPLDVSAPSTATIQAALDSANLKPASLSDFAFINTDGLDDPEINDIQAGSVTYGSDRQSATCDATAQATWENDSVSVQQTVKLPFTYNTSTSQWDAGRPSTQSEGQKVQPTGPADLELVQGALPDMLKEYDAEIAKQFESPEIAATANLDKDGGEITFALDQTNEDETHTQTDVNVGLTWNDEKGWEAKINWVGEIIGGSNAEGEGGGAGGQQNGGEPSNGNGQQSGDAPQGGGDADMQLSCTTGDLVEVPGIIEYRDNRVLLRSDYTIHVTLDGRAYLTKYFELTANTFVVTNGAHVSVVGEISATGGLQGVPLMINLDYES